MIEITKWLPIIISVFALFISSYQAIAKSRKEDFDRVTKAIEYVTTGNIAECRHRVASFSINTNRLSTSQIATAPQKNKPKKDIPTRTEIINDSFKLIWALNYIKATDKSVEKSKISQFFSINKYTPQMLLRESLKSFITWHIGPLPEEINDQPILIQINNLYDLKSGDMDNLVSWSKNIYK